MSSILERLQELERRVGDLERAGAEEVPAEDPAERERMNAKSQVAYAKLYMERNVARSALEFRERECERWRLAYLKLKAQVHAALELNRNGP